MRLMPPNQPPCWYFKSVGGESVSTNDMTNQSLKKVFFLAFRLNWTGLMGAVAVMETVHIFCQSAGRDDITQCQLFVKPPLGKQMIVALYCH